MKVARIPLCLTWKSSICSCTEKINEEMGVHRKYLNDYIFTFGNCWCHRLTPSVGLAAVTVDNIAQWRSQDSLLGG